MESRAREVNYRKESAQSGIRLTQNDTATVEKLRSNVYDIMHEESRTAQRTRAQDMER